MIYSFKEWKSERKILSYGKEVTLVVTKLLELVLAGTLAVLLYTAVFYSYDSDKDNERAEMMYLSGVFSGYLLLHMASFLSLLTCRRVDKRLDVWWCVVGTITHIVAGALALNRFKQINWLEPSDRYHGITLGSLSLIQAAVLTFNAVFSQLML